MSKALKNYQKHIEDFSPSEILDWAIDTFGVDQILLASSLSLEDQILTSLLTQKSPSARIFTLDTGRLFQESYDLMQDSMKHFQFKYEVCFPSSKDIMDMISEKGPNLFYNSILDRKQCCYVRKVRPLSRILKTAQAWITGLRVQQSSTRLSIKKIEWDHTFGLYKINPLAFWSLEDVWKDINEKKIPYNPLHKKGFLSIGCMPCTRAIQKGEEERKGRWWWENPNQKECGLHNQRKKTIQSPNEQRKIIP